MLIEITEKDFNALFSSLSCYFCNGCAFDDLDNLVAFPVYNSGSEIPVKYFKVVLND